MDDRAVSNHGGDALRANEEQINRTLAKSRCTWNALCSSAQKSRGIPSACRSVQGLLHKTPSIPPHSSIDREFVARDQVYLEAHSVWTLGSTTCELKGKFKRSRTYKVVAGLKDVTYCSLSEQFLGQDLPDNGHCEHSNRYLMPMMILGWCYVLSTCLVETRRASGRDRVTYTDMMAELDQNVSNDTMSIGLVEPAERRWWAAVLARGCGWQAVLNRSGRNFYPPWSCHFDPTVPVSIHYELKAGSTNTTNPLSAASSQACLYKFARQNNALQECIAALAAVLTLPRIHRFGAPIRLLGLNTANAIDPAESLTHDLPISTDKLLSLMAFSCIPNTIASSILGSLWEPDVTSNLVSQWLCPVLNEICPRILSRDQLILVRMMTDRRPNTGPLWLGAALTGLLPTLMRLVSHSMPPTSLESSQWTDSSQSFMDSLHSPLHRNDRHERLSCADEHRLLYLTDVDSAYYASPPLSPWPLSGTTELHDTTLDVRNHVSCQHRLVYHHWMWAGEGGQIESDYGFVNQPSSEHNRTSTRHDKCDLAIHEYPKGDICGNEALSRIATTNVYRWLIADGVKRKDMSLFQTHEWLEDVLADDEDEGTDQASDSSHPSQRNGTNDDVIRWLNGQDR